MELSSLPLMLLLISNIQPGQTKESLKPVVIIEPDKNETVTVRCKIPGNEDDWTYSWFTDGLSQPFSTGREFRFKIEVSDSSNITCRGQRKSDRQKSEFSDAVTLTVSFLPETPKPVLTVQPEPSQIFRGETVTLTCDIQGEGWTYRWQCGNDTQQATNEKELKITAAHKQMCRCYSCRGSDCSKWSNKVTLTVFDKPRVTVKPQSSVFTGDTVTLSCDVGWSTGLRFIWYKDFNRIKSGAETEALSDVRVSDGGKYGCGVEGKYSTTLSPGVTLTVRERPKAVVRVQPDGRVFRGQTVTLTCDIQEKDITSWSYTWKKDDSVIHESQSQEYRISSVNESHTGHYSCRGNETDGSRYSHTSDEVTLTLSGFPSSEAPLPVTLTASGSEAPLPVLSVVKLISFLLAASPYLLVSFIIGVKSYRVHGERSGLQAGQFSTRTLLR
ncbi:sialoadhesin-like isoform X6 [Ctenopharyngodon idella]|uniref:sialoadhesin-like isoform X6 n=1 Tax=Ctenopharyngodon idella TaxID=7959 RepID=UPI002231378A|nr:sialoadhesin-like isoform X6 [Ctenopharyngodon idella]